jgi:hypothetical protein
VKKKLVSCALSAFAICFLTHCQQPTGSQTLVNLPPVTVTCTSSNCAVNSSTHAIFVYITNSGCQSIQYGQVATGTGTASCSAGTCSATVTSWTNTSGVKITQIASSTFDYCAILNLDDAYVNAVTASEATGTKKSVFVGDGSPTVSLTTWINAGFTN